MLWDSVWPWQHCRLSSGVWSTNRIAKDGGNQQGNEEEEEEDRANWGDHYCTPFDKKTWGKCDKPHWFSLQQERQTAKRRDISRQVVVKPPGDFLPLFFFLPQTFFEQHQQKAGCRHPMLLCFWGSGEPINVCSQRGKSIQKANCSLRPWAKKKWERQRETVQREKEARGLTTCFLCSYILRGITWSLQHWRAANITLTLVHWSAQTE